ncbi:fasciclin-like arabinogalactan protein 14 [Selaginella moellendorffii]|uniref:fasciclin-like arabinogalactan protein 14 n=1 Tax=Selaginella moellendorffii TaxID=88036 RepID=UPI000D1C5605|nr:fasciclin-like arabinogalactan protein 14 [Selaginella moellendorffii]XP_024538255.1 fasciclin-like arabinogalactan protein 14 [Selaginella moellendorffii]|eukprot:XP_024538254.1 fasciclin-like arabinogalactan protein 14 [Selaginella moellendorffii]
MAAILVVVAYVFAVWSSSKVVALPRNLTTILSHYPEFSNFNTLLTETSVAEVIDNMESATLFVPDNSKLLRDLIFQLRVDPSMMDLMSDLCKFHATSDYLDVQRFKSNSTTRVETLLPRRSFLITVDTRGDMRIVDSNRSSLTKPAIIQGNVQSPGTLGVISIDRVLNPAYALRDAAGAAKNDSAPTHSNSSSSDTTTTNSTSSSASFSSDEYRAPPTSRTFVLLFTTLVALFRL